METGYHYKNGNRQNAVWVGKFKTKKMKTGILLSMLFLSFSFSGFSTVWKVTYSGYKFTPDVITINTGDSVKFELSAYHNASEVDERTWSQGGNSHLASGFETPYGGGLLLPDKLGTGTHYFVCTPHASLGMKGKIIVQAVTAVSENKLLAGISVYPNPATDFIKVKTTGIKEDTFVISDQAGRQVLSGRLNPEATINISSLVPGLYFLQAGEQRKQVYKIVKQ